MKIFLTGASGLVGAEFAQAARRRGHTVIGTGFTFDGQVEGLSGYHQVDLTDHFSIQNLLLDAFPDAIVNAAALSSPADCDENPEKAHQLNTALPEALAQIAHHLSARFLHLSTDLVFSGESGPAKVTDRPNPTNLYGKTKAASEQAVCRAAPVFATVVRIPILTGNSPRGQRSVHEKLFAQWSQGIPAIFSDQDIRQPVSAENVSALMVELLERNDVAGIHQWAGAEPLSRWEMADRIRRHFGLPEHLVQKDPEGRACDLRLDLHPLAGKCKTPVEDFTSQLEKMVVPRPARDWFNQLEE
ncbi:MAG: SDR family oxidoreductase [Opitutales bacterium]|nr:SDR family oxidoreductase [Opitutales bacterium]